MPKGSARRLRAAPGWGRARVLAIGHSTWPAEELVEALAAAGVVTVADVRTIPRSRANPQFEGPALARSLARAGIAYAHLPRLAELRELVRGGPVALLCAEAVPWRCHRSLLADALLARGVVVAHIVGRGRTRPHRLTPFARLEGRRVTYPPAQAPTSRL